MADFSKVFLKPNREKSILRKHLWIFSGAVYGVSKELQDGEIVEVFSHDKQYLATGHFQNGSICVRIFSFNKIDKEKINDFWKEAITNAINRRKVLNLFDNPNTNSFRLIHGESDLMPGLIADYYNEVVVLQAHSVGMLELLPVLTEVLKDVLKEKLVAVYSKSGSTIKQTEDNDLKEGFLYGSADEITFTENDMKFHLDLVKGQKTGFFLDQRDNRKILSEYCKGKSVLNVFGYTGAFSVAAFAGGASKVVTVDVSENAIEMANRNIELNFGKNVEHQGVVADAFEFLKNNEEKFDIVILDPPAFAKHLDAKNNAMKAYRRLNAAGFNKLNRNGLLFTFSCSQVITKPDFFTAIYNAAGDSKKQTSIVHQLHQAPDHPINIFHPETEYLKGLVLLTD
ncbi:class I SAM-dependent rRNA methyltransferase [Bacteroidales bacterium OttesenSCG-928-K03]|nr:class I SAM-dependent rRNA methyltransferase [Odoribacter sp. OttesenSCG-928-L07]MDL2239439.1 class I SAM-dependent rRNA methyltransferase [Bacteroidales bacterium OttesenSCG-928-L14]MDL2240560.1 class I SAM-dependent rRNA methyltransferase [Bacteroidales bacterium OttesenSCG-928-K22]MDL2242658.1 class I SAM-dependent rRNA methyltransferase [Bacteroidales bacterium OttesenSCG-928-K03]